ncbi:MAG TPA: bacteriophage abortive infection AbiH family protein [Puia sp.]|nr:bacteriophage abortive infection AbiH family protein [Puia sp.]
MKKNKYLHRRRPMASRFHGIRRRTKHIARNVLVIVGNGFDLHHGIPSSYWNFRDYIVEHDNDLLDTMEEHFASDSLWSDFEGTLAYLDTDMIADNASDYLVSYGAEDWSDAYHHDYQRAIDEVLNGITDKMPKLFTEWVLQLPVTNDVVARKLNLIRKAKFLTFNYTPTLEIVYQIPADRICYLHHKAVNINSNLIVGHGIPPTPKAPPTEFQLAEMESADPRVLHGERSLAGYLAETYKPTDKILRDNKVFFESLRGVDEIHVLGHSLSDVDWPYFRRVVAATRRNFPLWKFSFHDPSKVAVYRQALEDMGIPPDNIRFARMASIYNP